MKDDEDLEAILRGHRFERDPMIGEHIGDEALASKIERGEPLDENQRAHLASCAECRDIAGVLMRQRAPRAEVVPLFKRRDTFAGIAVAASVALLSLVISMPPEDEYRGKGGGTSMAAEV